MGAQVVDYRVSAIVVLCKDCGNDVGLYPARHKCTPVDRPPMPPLPLKFSESSLSSAGSASASSETSLSVNKWGSRREKTADPVEHMENTEESIYFNNFAQNLPDANEQPSTSGRKLWGKVRQNDKWKQLNEKNDKPKQTGKLWGKLMQATQTMAEKMPSRDDRGAESDEDDWEGETHVSRIIREYYEKERLPLPSWLFDDRAPKQKVAEQLETVTSNASAPARTPSRRRLWDENPERELSSREKERQELRQQPPPPLPESHRADHYRRPSIADKRSHPNESKEHYVDHYREDYYDERRGYEDNHYHRREENKYDHYGKIKTNQQHNNTYYQPSQPSPHQQHRYYEEEAQSKRRGYDNRYNHQADDHYYSPPTPSSNRYPTNLREHGRVQDSGRGGYKNNNESYNYF
ncbi:hypothetical protein G6F57_000300 [Rhizopus arrhizus]|nr:hypothetical protein G6F23_000502 [Rhizopus arrhizus]KAG1429357.1 hypothetical protein G6F58_000077 [Rhizopus delemar]KAG0770427.1 hypothetical protein G6F24_000221 [Rhizopus arrhizus]KAG0794570.1 hypothetical protein G6F21_002766 [Rhizopus arrhizus]KAG0801611.1 hypothetical protein G6F22_001078 [Rhizopus arrhizus]